MSVPTPLSSDKRAQLWLGLVSIFGLVFLLIPRRSSWTITRIFAEDGQVFLSESLRNGIGGLFDTYAGYLHIVPRLISNGCVQVGPEAYVSCTTVSADLVRILGVVVAFPVLTRFTGSWKWGLLAASSFVLIPVGQQEVLGNITNLRWFLVAMAFFAIMGVFNRPAFALFATLIAIGAVLSDPLALFLIPFALWRLVSVTGFWARVPSIGLLFGALTHILLIEPTTRETRGGFSDLIDVPSQAIAQLLVRGPLVTQIGMTATQDALLRFGVIPSVLILTVPVVLIYFAWLQRLRPDPTLIFVFLLGVVGTALLVITLSFPASYIALADIWAPGQPARYSALTGLFLTPALILLMQRVWMQNTTNWLPRIFAGVSGALLLIGLFWDAGGDARHAAGDSWGWVVTSGQNDCLNVNVDPAFTTTPDYEGWRTQLTCEWLR
jgi:hypothetical protein